MPIGPLDHRHPTDTAGRDLHPYPEGFSWSMQRSGSREKMEQVLVSWFTVPAPAGRPGGRGASERSASVRPAAPEQLEGVGNGAQHGREALQRPR